MTDTSIKNNMERYQFERIGYFCRDYDSTDDNVVMNMITSLKENKGKNI
jgi:hypothetical protein